VYGLAVDPVNDDVFASACDDGKVHIYDLRAPPSEGHLVQALISFDLALCLLSASLSSVFMVLYVFLVVLVHSLHSFSELSLVGLALDLVD